jgi:hypothetical protein
MSRELVWRAVAAAIFAGVFAWSLATSEWAVAAITGALGLWTLVNLGVGIFAWKRGLLRGHS